MQRKEKKISRPNEHTEIMGDALTMLVKPPSPAHFASDRRRRRKKKKKRRRRKRRKNLFIYESIRRKVGMRILRFCPGKVESTAVT